MFYQNITEYPKSQLKEKTYLQEKKNIKTIDWNCTGQYLATGDNKIQIWAFDGNNLKKHTDLKQGSEQLDCLLFHPQNPDLLASVTKESVRIWDLKSKMIVRQEKREFTGQASWHPNGNILACGSKFNKEQQVYFLDMRGTGDLQLIFAQPKEKTEKHQLFEMKCLAYDPMGDVFVVGGSQNNQGVIQIYDARDTDKLLDTIDSHQAAITAIKFTNSYLITAGADSLILIWSLPELLCVASLQSVESEIRTLSVSYDEKWLSAVASEDYLYFFAIEKCLAGATDHIDIVKCEGKPPQAVVYHPNKLVVTYVCQEPKDSIIHLYGQLSS